MISRPNRKRLQVDLRYDGEASGSIISPAGGGKTSCCVITTLLTDGSTMIVHDPSLELFSTTHKHRRECLNNEIVVLCPWEDEANEILGEKLVVDAGIDFYGTIDLKGKPELIRDDVKNRSELILPDSPKIDHKSRYFESDGRIMTDFVTLTLIANGHKPTLPAIREFLMAGPTVLNDLFVRAMDSSAFAGELALLGNYLNGLLTAAPQQFAGGFGCATQAVELFSKASPVGKHVSSGGIGPKRLTKGRNITIYVCYPGERIKTHKRLATATFTYLFQQVCRSVRGNRVTALIDEAAELECPFPRFMNIGRKYNLRIFLVYQDLHGQVEAVMGKENVRQIIAASDLLWATSLRGETAELFSKMLGMRAADNFSLNDQSRIQQGMPDQSFGRSHQSVPLLRPEEIQQLPKNKALVIHGTGKPVLVNKVPYYTRSDLLSVAGPNPYRGK
ncbi:type IV secretory system conjugative DNA transfer family protein [Thalassoglobus sp.]|uniref:type IV secretory system conjugative DNA transfer family protein n=1 Tax=Thalassoglobus sp. TaxID=2795869 RepID=UPI003AA92E22